MNDIFTTIGIENEIESINNALLTKISVVKSSKKIKPTF